ncbi:disease resistance protein L6-like [Rhodamnia argentea]|uniref:ADP-ribosyl cyclase/cyclic ADP-ribose hydrolase n=1 Tax=Rhodamnia argentea TaxID=178133 RepID=A0A8B8Q662_9MYRT|nr:disease resistance protein L6-like [Rhodamnia argentea]
MAMTSGFDHEVFLSFRGPRYSSRHRRFPLCRPDSAGIRAYRDNEELRFGEEIGAELLGAIHQSKISIPIFSRSHASSKWCLQELAQMAERGKTRGQKIMPIFCDVAPFEVRHQTGSYREAFLLHESKKQYDDQTINRWKAALNEVGSLKGWDLQSKPKRHVGEFTRGVVREVFRELKKTSLGVSDYLVPIDNHVDEIIKKIGTYTPRNTDHWTPWVGRHWKDDSCQN